MQPAFARLSGLCLAVAELQRGEGGGYRIRTCVGIAPSSFRNSRNWPTMRTLQVHERAREESNLQPPGPQPGVLSIELRAQVESIVSDSALRGNFNPAVISSFPGGMFWRANRLIFP